LFPVGAETVTIDHHPWSIITPDRY